MFVSSFPKIKHTSMLAIFVRLANLAAVCCGTSSSHVTERLERENTETNKIHRRQVLIENLNVEIYMAAERGFITKPSDTFDGQTKSFEDFQFDMQNTLTDTAMTARGEMERGAAQVMMTILDKGGRMTLGESNANDPKENSGYG